MMIVDVMQRAIKRREIWHGFSQHILASQPSTFLVPLKPRPHPKSYTRFSVQGGKLRCFLRGLVNPLL